MTPRVPSAPSFPRIALAALALGLAGCASGTLDTAAMLRSPALGDGSAMDVAPLTQGARRVTVVQVTPDNIASFAAPAGGAATGEAGWTYRVGAGDVLQLHVVDEPELTQRGGYRVAEDGAIQVPYLGRVPVDGRALAEIRDDLVARLSRYRAAPQVDVRVTEFNARHAAVVGEVRRPSRQTLTDQPMTVIDAINAAGGFAGDPERANVTLIRGGIEQPVDIRAFLTRGAALPVLRDGDVVRVGGRQATGRAARAPVPEARVVRANGRAERIALDRGPVSVAQVALSDIARPAADVIVMRPSGAGIQALRLDPVAAQSPVMGGRFALRPGDVVTFAAAYSTTPDMLLPQISPALRLLDRL